MTSPPPFDHLDGQFAMFKHELLAEMHKTLDEAVHRIILVVVVTAVGSVLTATSLAFAAARLV